MKEIPMLSANLIEQLDEDEPKLSVKPGMSKDDIMYRAGRRSLIEELLVRQEYYEKNHNNPENKVEL